ncbi:hypothetical protein [Novosphingobium mangrovi (ex Huang et al. 2023)]|uniref:Gellan polysaccharide biosynthesis protein GelF n=1 Tax=Novosphingobium mangrovi (ex Huang et al. 2023) TaxID=2976432 RepID=A0ABT2I0T8_9SPHN|nr:hypothetical protein [Novosphingobium mangrovi (ex Huang et al. 2023)]MCT2398409.1 hypothetical protein [Novosphingobium mangrovi (ex Huang et al. 2023)]
MLKSKLVGLCAVGCVALASPAWAQSAPVMPQSPHTDIVITARGLYDGNVVRGTEDLALQRDLKRRDFRFTPSVDADIYQPLGPGYVSLTGSVGYDFYARNTRLNRERIDANLGAGGVFGPCGVETKAGVSRKQSELGDLNTAPGVNGSTKNTETRFSGGTMVGCGGFVGIKPYVLMDFETARNSAQQRKGSDYNSVTYGGGLMYSQPSIGELRVFATQRDVDFVNRDQFDYFGAPKLRIRSAGGQFSRDIGARLGAFVMVAYTNLKQQGVGAGKNGFDGLTWQARLTLKASDRLSLKATASQDTIPTLGFNVDYMKRTDYGLQADMDLNSRMSLRVMASHRTRDFKYSPLATMINITHDRLNSIGAALKIEPIGPFSLSLDAMYENRNADLAIYDYDALRAGITLQMQI